MKASVYVACMGMSLCTYAQGTWFDSFSDHSLRINPAWSGDTSNFIQSPNDLLQLNDSIANESWIFTPSIAELYGTWRGYTALDFNPSSSNFATIILCDDTLGNRVELHIGGQSNDLVTLTRVSPAQTNTLTQSPVDFLDRSSVTLFWEVQRKYDQWTLQLKRDSSHWEFTDSILDTLHFPSHRFGIGAKYTKSRSTKFYWDDLYVTGIPYRDTIRPFVSTSKWTSRSTLEIVFSESIASYPTHVNDLQNGSWTVSQYSANEFHLERDTSASNGFYQLDLSSFEDGAGLVADTLGIDLHRPAYRNIHFSEIHYNANNESPWPYEFLEIASHTSDTMNLKNWSIQINQKKYELPDTQFVHRIAFSNGPSAINCTHLPFSSLPNSGALLELLDDWGDVIDHIEYLPSWHSAAWKESSGWSLERNEKSSNCETESAWSSAGVNGGSPGKANQPESNIYSPLNALENISVNDSGFTLLFAFPLEQLILQNHNARAVDLTQRSWQIADTGLVSISGNFCGGFEFDTTIVHLNRPKTASDVRFTELLVDPKNGLPEFIEIVNFSGQFIDLHDVFIGEWSKDYGAENLVRITNSSTLVGPRETVVLCAEPLVLFLQFNNSNRRSLVTNGVSISLPASGGLCLVDSTGTTLDSVYWSEDSYHPLTDPTASVSLRRVHFNAEEKAWTSTSTGFGNATPGIYHFEETKDVDEPTLHQAQFSPNNDGIFDELIIHLPDSWEGRSCSMNILTTDGNSIAQPIQGYLVAKGDVLRWNGCDENRKTLLPGQYLIEIQTLSSNGTIAYWHHGCLLTSQ